MYIYLSLKPVNVTLYGKVFVNVIKDFEIILDYLDGL